MLMVIPFIGISNVYIDISTMYVYSTKQLIEINDKIVWCVMSADFFCTDRKVQP